MTLKKRDLNYRIDPVFAQKIAREMKINLRAKTMNRPFSANVPVNDHAFFLKLTASPTMQQWMGRMTKNDSFEIMKIISDMQNAGYDGFKEWLNKQIADPRNYDPADPRIIALNPADSLIIQEAVNREAAIQQAMADEQSAEETAENMAQALLESPWLRAAATGSEDVAESSSTDPGKAISELATSMAGLSTAEEAIENPEFQTAAKEFTRKVEQHFAIESAASGPERGMEAPRPPSRFDELEDD